jgi:hypothetical protein
MSCLITRISTVTAYSWRHSSLRHIRIDLQVQVDPHGTLA